MWYKALCRKSLKTLLVIAMTTIAILFTAASFAQEGGKKSTTQSDMLTPLYYLSTTNSSFRIEVDRFISSARKESFHHPLMNESGKTPGFSVPGRGQFGAGKGPGGDKQHHPAVDFHVANSETEVAVYAAHGGTVSTFRDAPKYRQYLAITQEVTAENGDVLGKIVTIYAHIDLDLDETGGLSMNGRIVRKGDLVSNHLYSGTRGGPHLHFEIRYYRPDDNGTETFYGFRFPGKQNSDLIEKSAKPWSYGYWNPHIGYGFGHPGNHGISGY